MAISEIVHTQTNPDAQHAQGKLTAHERLNVLLDEGSFEEFLSPDLKSRNDLSVMIGHGTIHGKRVYVFAKDDMILKGTLSSVHAENIKALQTEAIATRAPIIGLFNSGGMRREDAAATLAGYADIAHLSIRASGLIPQISLIMGSCIGGDAFLVALSDFIFMVEETASLFVTGPEITNRLTGSNLTSDTLGGSDFHKSTSGLAEATFANDITALMQLRKLIDFLPSSHNSPMPIWESFDKTDRIELALDSLVPDNAEVYDVKEVILKIVDENDFFEIKAAFAANVIIGFGRMQGRTVGVIANQPLVLGGVLDADATRKAARFIRFCDCFNLPIITLVDMPGFLPGLDQEEKALAAQGAKLLFAYAEATSPKVTVILGPSYGPAYVMMASKHLSSDMIFAWPSAIIGLMKADGATVSAEAALTQGAIDAIIAPSATRLHILEALSSLCKKPIEASPKKHNNMPL